MKHLLSILLITILQTNLFAQSITFNDTIMPFGIGGDDKIHVYSIKYAIITNDLDRVENSLYWEMNLAGRLPFIITAFDNEHDAAEFLSFEYSELFIAVLKSLRKY